ncbi:E3 ubiquitin-protein ligase WAV3 [Bienertia sinuspersici]
MAPKYDDDEMIDEVEHHIDDEAFEGGKTTARYANNSDAPLAETNFKVLMELTGSADAEGRPGLDLVMVLDISGSMKKKDRIEHMKTASKFVVKKLSPIDRLSVIKFSTHAERLCPLRQMTLDAQSDIESLISELHTEYKTNMTEALEEALRVIHDRRLNKGRQVAIMFMSDGEPNPSNADGSQAHIEDVPVYTFGLGQDTDHEVLQNIASRSKNATFSTITDVAGDTETSNLSVAFSQCLAGLLSIVVEDLTLTITPQKGSSRIVNVSAGRYKPNEPITPEEPVTLSFGNLYSKEIRNNLVNLVLEEVKKPKGTDILEFTYSYKRNEFASTKENPEVLMEETRQNTAEKMKQARVQADANNLSGAQATINEAQNDLKKVDVDQSDPKMQSLEAELAQFLKYLETPEIYAKLGRAFALASELSHSLQRFAARGDPNELRLFATDAMDNVLQQVKEYTKNPADYKVPTPAEDAALIKQTNDDAKKVDDPVKVITGALSVHLGDVIQSLQAIQEIINKYR